MRPLCLVSEISLYIKKRNNKQDTVNTNFLSKPGIPDSKCSENWVDDKASHIALFQFPLNFRPRLCKNLGRSEPSGAEIRPLCMSPFLCTTHQIGNHCTLGHFLFFAKIVWKRTTVTALGQGKSEGAIKLICRVNIKESAMLASMEATYYIFVLWHLQKVFPIKILNQVFFDHSCHCFIKMF